MINLLNAKKEQLERDIALLQNDAIQEEEIAKKVEEYKAQLIKEANDERAAELAKLTIKKDLVEEMLQEAIALKEREEELAVCAPDPVEEGTVENG